MRRLLWVLPLLSLMAAQCGSSGNCTVSKDESTGTATIRCPDGSSVDVGTGEGGKGAGGTSCTVTKNGDAGVTTVSCADGTVATVEDGSDGLQSLVRLDEEPPGATCAQGGTRVQVGLDADRDGVLEPAEVSQTRFICHPLPTPGGVDAGADGGWGSDGGLALDGGTPDGGAGMCAAVPVACFDAAILNLGLKSSVNPDGITNVPDGNGWISTVNASAGGIAPTSSFVYAVFTQQGLAQMPLPDDVALSSTQWDIGFRRYIIRLNGGDSGPSCVAAAAVNGAGFSGVTANTATGASQVDGFLDASCAFVGDGTGLASAPSTAMSGYFSYQQCVRMTGTVFVITLADGRRVKAEVLGYYQSDAAQLSCQSGTPTPGSTGGYIKLRWAFL